ncbi:MAG: hypothetical protein P4L53_07020 [Candidatus Obscuribacterales bacterium]|nr:hypothetical protein [Candidatus Obscuribacterales bacterium]
MRSILTTTIIGLLCLVVGLFAGTFQGSQIKATAPGQWVTAAASKLQAGGQSGDDNQIESDEYPTLKWKAKPLLDAAGSIVRLWTTFEAGPNKDTPGTLKYKLTLFKAVRKDTREVQLLDFQGFKLMQFNATDFHDIPGAPDIVEARDAVPCSEADYKKIRDYSVK